MKFRNPIIIFNDFILLCLSLHLSYFLRLDEFININQYKFVFLISIIIYFIIFFQFRILEQFFRHFNQNSYSLYLKFYLVFLTIFCIFVFFQKTFFIPRSISFIFPTLFFILILISRFLFSNIYKKKFIYQKKHNAILIGFNPLTFNSIFSYANVICFIDNQSHNIGRSINGVKIYSSKKFLDMLNKLKFDLILIENDKSFEEIKFQMRDYILKNEILVQKIKIKEDNLITSPYFDFNYFFNKKSKITKFGNIYDNKCILITGAGGSIGSNIVFQILNSKFKKLILVDNSEYNLFKLSTQLHSHRNISLNLLDFSDNKKISEIIIENKVEIIFHSAAFKHVPIIESNIFSAIKNNFICTYDFIKLSISLNVAFFCLVSSDKAVRPTNLMGSSKRLAELALLYFVNSKKNLNTNLCAVRFGNVINSSGSVMPLFKKQIQNNLAITITHKDIIRYFMTIEEAANLVLNVMKISKGGEIFLLDMGNPIKLIDLAKLMVQFSGKKIKKKDLSDGIEIEFIGLRPGEKLYEELLIDNESIATSIKSIFKSDEQQMPVDEFKKLHKKILDLYNNNDGIQLKKVLKNNFINYSNHVN